MMKNTTPAKILHHMRLLKRLGLVQLIALLFASGICFGQVVDPVTAARQPVPGSGHSYIGVGTETVNPADGSVTFDLPINTPVGRGISFPFSIHYSESAPFYINGSGTESTFGWSAPNQYGNPPFSLGGWSYTLPNYIAQAIVAYGEPSLSTPDQYDYCWASQDYRFTGFEGSHMLMDAFEWIDPNNPDQSTYLVCQDGGGKVGLNGGYSDNGDDGIYSASGTMSSTGSSAGPAGTQPSLTVTDRYGDVYQFPQGPTISVSAPVAGATAFGALAQTITDRNGNQISLSGTNGTVVGGGLPAGSYTDTAGRSVVSWTGIGNSIGDQIAVPGLGTITVKWTTANVTFPTGYQSVYSSVSTCAELANSSALPISVVSEIDLPNSQKYSFSYGGQWGRLVRITFPSGGYVRYVWGTNSLSEGTYHTFTPYNSTGTYWCLAEADAPAITDRYVSYDGQTEVLHQQFSNWSTNWSSNGYNLFWTSKSTKVTSSDLLTGQTTVTNYSYIPFSNMMGPNDSTWHAGNQVPLEQSVIYQDGSGNTLRTENQTWADQFSIVGDQTILDNGQGITTLRCIDGYDRVLASYEYDFQANGSKPTDPGSSGCALPNGQTLSGGLTTSAIGPLLRQTYTTYHVFSNTHILDKPDSVVVDDGSGNSVSQTTYQYDQSAVSPSGAQIGLVAPSGLRGNATSVYRWDNTSNSSLLTTYKYFDTGQIYQMTDPCGNASCTDMTGSNHTTTYSYTDNFYTGIGSPPGGKQTFAYLKQVTDPLGHTDVFSWGYNDGLIRSRTDQDNQTTSYSYGTEPPNCGNQDYLDRLTEVLGPPDPNNGSQRATTTYCYNDSPPYPTITSSELLDTSGKWKTTVITMDGMGHAVQTALASDPAGPVYANTIYNGFGQVYEQSNPTRCSSSPGTLPGSCSESTWGYTRSNYNALGRKTQLTHEPDGSSQSWSYSGSSVTFTDEDLNQWQQTSDALSRLIQVSEPNGATKTPSLVTNYKYDLQNNLLSVTQSGVSGTDTPRARNFNYDSLSRLRCASNAENSTAACPTTSSGSYTAGTTGYSYDANSNVDMKTDARGVTTNYAYDALNRLIGKTYSNAPAGSVSSCYEFDTATNGVGRLGSEWTQAGSCPPSPPVSPGYQSLRVIGSYDSMGRITSEKQCTPGFCTSPSPPSFNCNTPAVANGLSYCYDLAGNLTNYSNGLTSSSLSQQEILFAQGFDSAGRLSTVNSSLNGSLPPNLLTVDPSIGFWPFGAMKNWYLGSKLNVNRNYDPRLRVIGETATQQ